MELINIFFLICLGDPLVTTVLIRAKDRGSMHRLYYLNEAVQLLTFIHENISVEFVNKNISKTVCYKDICGAFCNANIIINYFYVNKFFKP